MWNRFQKPLLALSIGLNVAFISIWMTHTIQDPKTEQRISKNAAGHAVSSSLHRNIGVTPEQWKQIEPHIQNFREKIKEQRHRMKTLRCQLLDLLATPAVDKKALQAKRKELCAGSCLMKGLAINLLLKEKNLLTPEQYNALIKEIRRKPNFHKEKNQRGRGIMSVLGNDESTPGKENAPN